MSVVCGKAENATIWDKEGNQFIDFAGGIAVLNTGHRHPKVIAAVTEQLTKFTHTAYQVTPYESYVALAERINERANCWSCEGSFSQQVQKQLKMQ